MRWMWIFACLLGTAPASVWGSVIFDWEDHSQFHWSYRREGVTENSTHSNSNLAFPTASLEKNGFFWANESNSLEVGETIYSEMVFSQAGITVSAYGGATAWPGAYTTTGIGISTVFLEEASSEYQEINLDGYGDTFRLRDTVSAMASATKENKHFLCVYAMGSEEKSDYYANPTLSFNQAVTVESLDLANAAYTYKALRNGSTFCVSYPDEFGVSIYSLDENGERIATISQEVMLSEGESVKDDWLTVWLEGFQDIWGLQFEIFSSDISSSNGINTPLYFAMDNLVLADNSSDVPPIHPPLTGIGVPEPATWLLLAGSVSSLFCLYRRKSFSNLVIKDE